MLKIAYEIGVKQALVDAEAETVGKAPPRQLHDSDLVGVGNKLTPIMGGLSSVLGGVTSGMTYPKAPWLMGLGTAGAGLLGGGTGFYGGGMLGHQLSKLVDDKDMRPLVTGGSAILGSLLGGGLGSHLYRQLLIDHNEE